MTLTELNERYSIGLETLSFYVQNGLLTGTKTERGMVYTDQDIQRAVQYHFLLRAGMELDTLKELIRLQTAGSDSWDKQLRILRKCRRGLVEKIHIQQQRLDQLDYLIHEVGCLKGSEGDVKT